MVSSSDSGETLGAAAPRFPVWGVILYPWFIFFASRTLGSAVARIARGRRFARRVGTRSWFVLIYCLLGIPLTFVVTAEILISANEATLGEQSSNRLESDFDLAPNAVLKVPGAASADPVSPASESAADLHQFLVEKYAPGDLAEGRAQTALRPADLYRLRWKSRPRATTSRTKFTFERCRSESTAR